MKSLRYLLARTLKKARGSAIDGSEVHGTAKIESGCQIVDSVFGRHSFCGYDCTLLNCEVGSFCSIASRVSVGGPGHPVDFVSTSPVFLSHRDSVKAKFARHEYSSQPRTIIGHDVWIGEGAYVKAGVRIGHGSVVGMASVVTRDVAPYSVVAGNPARLVRMRFEADVAEALLRLQWWDWPEEKLAEYGRYFDDPVSLLDRCRTP
jgi:chloramphenicol O-acetyltransferase type B